VAILKNSYIMNSSWCLCPCLPYFHTHPHDHMCSKKLPINKIRRPQRVFSIPCRDTSRLPPEPANLYWFVYQWGYTASPVVDHHFAHWNCVGGIPPFSDMPKKHIAVFFTFKWAVVSGQILMRMLQPGASSLSLHPLKKKWKESTRIWVNYNISLTWIKAIWGWCPLLTKIPVRSQWGRDEIYPEESVIFTCFFPLHEIPSDPVTPSPSR